MIVNVKVGDMIEALNRAILDERIDRDDLVDEISFWNVVNAYGKYDKMTLRITDKDGMCKSNVDVIGQKED